MSSLFKPPATTQIYTLSLHDALPIFAEKFLTHLHLADHCGGRFRAGDVAADGLCPRLPQDRKSTRLNSSHVSISYAVFCLKKKIANKHSEFDTSGQTFNFVGALCSEP